MAFASVGTIGTVASGSADQSSIVLTTSATVEAGNLAVVIAAFDNHNTTDADHSEATGVTDSAGNTWIKLAEYTNGQGAAQAGATVSMWASRLTTQLTSGGTITMALANATSRDATAMTGWEFTVGNGISVAGSTALAGDAADPAVISLSGFSNKEYLFIWGIAIESTTATTITQDADYTAVNHVGQGSGSTAMSVGGGFRIFTGTGDTVDASTSTGRDHVQILVVIQEEAGGTTYNQSVAGTLTTIGTVIKQTNTLRAGTLTTAGTVVKSTFKAFAGTLTSAGVLVSRAQKALGGTLASEGTLTKQTNKPLAGTLTMAGAIEAARAYLLSLAGTLGLSGIVTKSTSKSLSGALTTTGDLVKQTAKSLVGGVAMSGAVVKSTIKSTLAGTLTTIGTLTRLPNKLLGGTLTTAGTIVKLTSHTLQGTLNLSGNVAKKMFLSLAGTLTTIGTLATQHITAGAATAIVTLTARVRSFNLTAKIRNFMLNAKDRE